MKRSLIPILAITAIYGCASNKPPVFSETFIATINDYDMRQFHYTLAYDLATTKGKRGAGPNGHPREAHERGGRRGNMDSSKGRGHSVGPARDMSRKIKHDTQATVLERIEELITQSQYCKHGYFVIEKTFLQGNVTVFGECKSVVKN